MRIDPRLRISCSWGTWVCFRDSGEKARKSPILKLDPTLTPSWWWQVTLVLNIRPCGISGFTIKFPLSPIHPFWQQHLAMQSTEWVCSKWKRKRSHQFFLRAREHSGKNEARLAAVLLTILDKNTHPKESKKQMFRGSIVFTLGDQVWSRCLPSPVICFGSPKGYWIPWRSKESRHWTEYCFLSLPSHWFLRPDRTSRSGGGLWAPWLCHQPPGLPPSPWASLLFRSVPHEWQIPLSGSGFQSP